jgi:hypothetical protein
MNGEGIFELYRRDAEAAAQRSPPQPAQTAPQPGSMEWFEAQKKKGRRAPPIPTQCPECGGNPRLLCRGTGSSNPSPSSRQSVSLRISPRLPEKPGFSASLGTMLGGNVGRDAQGAATSSRGVVVSLSSYIPVPQCCWMRFARLPASRGASSELNS